MSHQKNTTSELKTRLLLCAAKPQQILQRWFPPLGSSPRGSVSLAGNPAAMPDGGPEPGQDASRSRAPEQRRSEPSAPSHGGASADTSSPPGDGLRFLHF